MTKMITAISVFDDGRPPEAKIEDIDETRAENWPVVIVESPFAGDMEANRQYAIRACVDCMQRGEVPYASHLFFPQFLDELQPAEREQGLTAGYAMWKAATMLVFYLDRGMSDCMKRAEKRAFKLGVRTDYRRILP